MTKPLTMAAALRFHISLNVANLERSTAFYRALFNGEPAKRRADYAKFELDDPPLVLSLEPVGHGQGGALNHLGFRLPDAAALVAMQRRLELAGIRSQREEGVECCYARQTKFWVTDPDNTLWEFYTLEGDIEHRGQGQTREQMVPPASTANGAKVATWEHRLGAPVPEVLPLADESIDEVLLRGTLNQPLAVAVQQRLMTETRRVLRAGGRVFVHVLVADRPLTARPQLPGPAAAVQHVPQEAEPVQLLEGAGFHGIRLLKFGAKPCFTVDGVEMREMQLEGWKPTHAGRGATVLYKGPFRLVTDDTGRSYPRGQRIAVDSAEAERLRADADGAAFTIIDAPV
jgi:catechol 2,3-dioxygenase-like lactoylglutathione lyase family enzyme